MSAGRHLALMPSSGAPARVVTHRSMRS